MKYNESKCEYFFDFSEKNDSKDWNDKNFESLIAEALNEIKNEKTPTLITAEGKKRFMMVHNYLVYIAKKNEARMTIRYGGLYSDIVFELEADVLDFDTNKLKEFFIDIMFLSKFVSIESRTNGKLAMIVELELFKRK